MSSSPAVQQYSSTASASCFNNMHGWHKCLHAFVCCVCMLACQCVSVHLLGLLVLFAGLLGCLPVTVVIDNICETNLKQNQQANTTECKQHVKSINLATISTMQTHTHFYKQCSPSKMHAAGTAGQLASAGHLGWACLWLDVMLIGSALSKLSKL